MWGLLKPQGSLSSSCDQSTFRLFVDATGDYSPGSCIHSLLLLNRKLPPEADTHGSSGLGLGPGFTEKRPRPTCQELSAWPSAFSPSSRLSSPRFHLLLDHLLQVFLNLAALAASLVLRVSLDVVCLQAGHFPLLSLSFLLSAVVHFSYLGTRDPQYTGTEANEELQTRPSERSPVPSALGSGSEIPPQLEGADDLTTNLCLWTHSRASFFDPPALFGSRHHDCRSLSRDEHVSGNCFRADRAPSRTGGQIFLNPERTSSEGSSWVIRKEMCRFVHGCVSKHLQRTSCSRALFVPRGVEQSGNASASEQSRLNWVPEYHTRVLWVQC
ncbi:hypothetical protein MJG53_005318 [Ovis ammon polii x Ovis aries]|uniref:Uncharacterized protein n=1 Tax=Ovis ammon polii x Ovis aries TaxID=2918886 RepID=A0ACB9VCS6_9CETA|nr:hypothetical protein MJG53_005318 [Ovis ammon polii x Ovis aries]